MKHKSIIYIVFGLLGLLLVSCEDFLNSESPSKFSPSVLFSNETEAFRAVRGIYSGFSPDQGYSIRLNMYYGVNNDVEWSSVQNNLDGGRRDVFTFEASPSNSEITNVFNNLYTNVINRANEVTDGMNSTGLFQNALEAKTPSMANHLNGEARALRAQAYLELVRNWGDVPFLMTAVFTGDDPYLPVTNRDTILDVLIENLVEIEPYMLSTSELTEGVERVSKEFVQGLIARLALTRGGWSLRPNLDDPSDVGYMYRNEDYRKYYELADTYLNKIIVGGQHTLEKSDFATVFRNQMQYKAPKGEDMIFEFPMQRGVKSEVGGYIGIRVVGSDSHEYGNSSAAVMITPTCYYSFDKDDLRRTTVASHRSYNANLYEEISSPTSFYVGKWNRTEMDPPLGSGSTTKSMGVNWPLLRYADVLLMYAETQNEINNGPTDAARNALKEVRRRAFSPEVQSEKVETYVNNLSSKEAFFDALVNERMWELGGELIRKYDLIRWNLLGKKIRQMRLDLIDMGKDALAKDPKNGIADAPGRFTNLPAKVYYINGTFEDPKLKVEGLFEEAENPGEEWSSKGWLTGLMKGDATKGWEPADFIKQSWRAIQGDDPNSDIPVPYIHPLPQTTIDNGGGKLKNYYGKGI